jgi:hypothetical protein
MYTWLLLLKENKAVRISSIDEIEIINNEEKQFQELKVTMKRGVVHHVGDFTTRKQALLYLKTYGINLVHPGD